MQKIRLYPVGILALIGSGFAPALTAGAAFPGPVTFQNHFESMTFDRPLYFAEYPGEDSVYVVLEQVGRITTVERRGDAWAKTVSATIAVPVISNTGSTKCTDPATRGSSPGITTGLYESRGLLGFAFHPQFSENRKYYVSYVTVENSEEVSVVAERIADSAGRPRSGDVERRLLGICQPYWDHNGGGINFGHDGKLYFATGDGGPQHLGNAGNPANPAQDKQGWLGKIIRIDVDTTGAGKPYAVPADNPFVGDSAYRPEIWALGLRNPWKWSFHPVTGKLWLGDVGYVSREEISVIPKGGNMGWKIWEGAKCNVTELCLDSSYRFVPPALSLLHNQDGRSVTGGTFVLRDSAHPYSNTYIFGDFIFNNVWAARVEGDTLTDMELIGDVPRVSSFDSDKHGQIFALSLGAGNVQSNTGIVYRVVLPDSFPPVALRPQAPRRKHLTRAEFLRNRDNYIVTGFDGRVIPDENPSGLLLVREKGSDAPARLLSPVE